MGKAKPVEIEDSGSKFRPSDRVHFEACGICRILAVQLGISSRQLCHHGRLQDQGNQKIFQNAETE
jgi:hypothetical protein